MYHSAAAHTGHDDDDDNDDDEDDDPAFNAIKVFIYISMPQKPQHILLCLLYVLYSGCLSRSNIMSVIHQNNMLIMSNCRQVARNQWNL